MENRMSYSGSGSSAAQATADTAARAHQALDDAVDKAAPAVNKMVDKAHATIDRVAQKAAPAAEAMHSLVEKTSDTSTRMMDACATTVRAQPITAIATAAAVGYLLGRLMR